MTKEEKVQEIIRRLVRVYPHPKTALTYSTPLELLVATILSAQTTDKLINQVTPNLFARFPTAAAYATASVESIDRYLTRVNFHRNKAKNIQAAATMILEKFHGQVPQTMEELDQLPGVARKTANVVLGTIFKKAEGIVVDTHVMRLSRKLGLTSARDPVKIERELMQVVPRDQWIDFSHLLILHGRDLCTARRHTCQGCPLGDLCPEYGTSSLPIP